MTKAELLDTIRNRLYLLGSQAAPSYTNDALYPFMDRAYHITIERAVIEDRVHLLSPIINSYKFKYSNLKYDWIELCYKFSIPSDFFIYISGIVSISRNSVGQTPDRKTVTLDEKSPKHITKFINTDENKLYFTNPKISIKNNRSEGVIVTDGFSRFDFTNDPDYLGYFDYVKYPEKFININMGDSPEILEPLHQDIAEKAAELAKKILDSGVAIQEVQADDLIKMS